MENRLALISFCTFVCIVTQRVRVLSFVAFVKTSFAMIGFKPTFFRYRVFRGDHCATYNASAERSIATF
jgi:hypothetical protein